MSTRMKFRSRSAPAGLLFAVGLLLPGTGFGSGREEAAELLTPRDLSPVEERFSESRPGEVEQGSDPLLTEEDLVRPEVDQHKGLDEKRREPIEPD